MYAQLELQHEFIRAVTPFYSVYNFKPRLPDSLAKIQGKHTPSWVECFPLKHVTADRMPSARAVCKAMRSKGKGYEVWRWHPNNACSGDQPSDDFG